MSHISVSLDCGQESGTDDAYGSRVIAQPEIGAGAELAAFEAALPRVLKLVGSVVAPTILLTALMYYFGWLEAAAFFWYLGAQVTVLDLTVPGLSRQQRGWPDPSPCRRGRDCSAVAVGQATAAHNDAS